MSNVPKVFLSAINTLPRERLAATPGLKPPVVEKIMERRSAGRPFTTMADFTDFTGITPVELQAATQALGGAKKDTDVIAMRRPIPEPTKSGKAPTSKTGAPAAKTPGGSPEATSPGSEGPIGSIRPGFYGKLPGYENLDTMDPVLKKEFLETVNRDLCTCGCSGETLAYCLVNDPGCPVVKARVKKIYDEISAKAPH